MKTRGRLALGLLGPCIWSVSLPSAHAATPQCATSVHSRVQFHGRVDTLVALSRGRSAALVSSARSASAETVRFLPHDDLRLVTGARGIRSVQLPPYITAPGLADVPSTHDVYVLVDSRLLVVDGRQGRVRASWALDVRALGWPAAIAVAGNSVYIAGQPLDGSPAARVEALHVTSSHRPRVAWRRSLGLTHAGIWLGVAGSGHLAVYLPDAHDLAGTMALLDTRSGRPVASGSVSGPPTSADATTGRIYVSVGERLRAQTVTGSQSSGPTTWIGTGSTAIATDPQHRLVAFKSAHGVTVASARTLHSLATFPLNSVTALAFTPDGSTLQAAGRYGLVTMNVARCTG